MWWSRFTGCSIEDIDPPFENQNVVIMTQKVTNIKKLRNMKEEIVLAPQKELFSKIHSCFDQKSFTWRIFWIHFQFC